MNFISTTKVPLILGWIFFIMIALFMLVSRVITFDWSRWFGYLDHNFYWQGLYHFTNGGINFRDFTYEYGNLYLVTGLPIFLILGKTFLASNLNMYIFIPALSIILTILIGSQVLRGWPLLFFSFLTIIYGTSSDYSSLRHVLPELGLIITLLGLEKNIAKKIVFGSLILGASLTTTPEYVIIANLTVVLSLMLHFIKEKDLKINLKRLSLYFGPFLTIAVIYGAFLWKAQILKNMVTFYRDNITFFYSNSPCRDVFFRFSEFKKVTNLESLIAVAQRLNLYVIPAVALLIAVYFILRKKSLYLLFPLAIYNLFAFARTLSNPCTGYMTYGLTFFFMLLIYLLKNSYRKIKFKPYILLVFLWFLSSSSPFNFFVAPFSFKDLKPAVVQNPVFLPEAGVKLKREITEDYQKIKKFIVENTTLEETIFIYPNGPYYALTGRKSATTISNTWHYDISPRFVEITVNQLKKNQPKFIIVNTYNAWSVLSALNNFPYNIYQDKKEIIFQEIITDVENFISANYQIREKFSVAWILEKKEKPSTEKKFFLPYQSKIEWGVYPENLKQEPPSFGEENKMEFKVSGRNPAVHYSSAVPQETALIKFPISIDLGIIKPFSKFIINVYGIDNDNKGYPITRQFVSSNWQNIWVTIPELPNGANFTKFILAVSDNFGFLPFGKPKAVSIEAPILFTKNPNLKIEDSAFE